MNRREFLSVMGVGAVSVPVLAGMPLPESEMRAAYRRVWGHVAKNRSLPEYFGSACDWAEGCLQNKIVNAPSICMTGELERKVLAIATIDYALRRNPDWKMALVPEFWDQSQFNMVLMSDLGININRVVARPVTAKIWGCRRFHAIVSENVDISKYPKQIRNIRMRVKHPWKSVFLAI